MKLTRLLLVCGLMIAQALPAAGAAGDFNADSESAYQAEVGYKIVNTTRKMGERGGYEWDRSPTAASFSATGGNGTSSPNGYVYQTISTDTTHRGYGLSYSNANFLGDLAQPGWDILQADLRVDGGVLTNFSQLNSGVATNYGAPSNGYRSFTATGPPRKVMARWAIDRVRGNYTEYDLFISKTACSVDLNAIRNGGWQTVAVALNSNNFVRWPNSQTYSVSFNQIRSDYSSIGLIILAEGDDMTRYGPDLSDQAWAWDNQAQYYRLTDYAAFSAGSTRYALDNLAVREQYNAWRAARFSAAELAQPAISGDTADPDGDGLNNLLEYAFDRNPRRADGMGVLQTTMETEVGTGLRYLVVSFTRRKAPTDLTYTVEMSTDLKTWDSGPGYTTELSATGSGVTELARIRIEPSSGATRQFARVKITLAPTAALAPSSPLLAPVTTDSRSTAAGLPLPFAPQPLPQPVSWQEPVHSRRGR